MGIEAFRRPNRQDALAGVQDGREVERAVFGVPKLAAGEKPGAYMPFGVAVQFVKEHQPGILERSKFAAALVREVRDSCMDTTVPVKLYTAIGTPLDYAHGVDAFIEQGDSMVTIDISMRDKEGMQKADVQLSASMDAGGKVIIDPDHLHRVAQEIARLLNERSQTRKAA